MLDLLTTKDAARELRVHVNTISKRVAAGTLSPAAKLNGIRGAYLFERSEIDRAKADS